MFRIFSHIDKRTAGILGVITLASAIAYLLYPNPKQEVEDSGKTEIVFWNVMDPFYFDVMKPVLEEFERRNPEYTVHMGTSTARSESGGDPTRFLLGVAGGMPPDLIFFDRFAIVEWASRGAFTDLNPYLERDRNLPDSIHEEDFYPMAWKEPIYKGGDYAVAIGYDTRAMYYNHDALLRAGFVYQEGDPDVAAGSAKVGDPRPPKTWEEICRKRMHANGTASAQGEVQLKSFVRRAGVNEDLPDDTPIDLQAAGVRAGDVVVLLSGTDVFRGRIGSIEGPDRFQIDLARDQKPGMTALPLEFHGDCVVKIIDQDGYTARMARYDLRTGRLHSIAMCPGVTSSLNSGNSSLYLFGWLNGGEFLSEDGTQCTMDDPHNVQALQWLTDLYDSIGGFNNAIVFFTSNDTVKSDPLFEGRIALRIDTSFVLINILRKKPNLEFGLTEPPLPEKQLAAGFKSFGWSGGMAYAIPSTAREKEGAWQLLKWLSSVEANKIWMEAQATMTHAEGQIYFPDFHSNRRVNQWLREKYVDGNGALSPCVIQAYHKFLEMLPTSRFRPVTPVGQKMWTEQTRAVEAALVHTDNPYETLSYGTRRIQGSLDAMLTPPTGPVINWRVVIGLYVGGIIALFGGLILYQRFKSKPSDRRKGSWIEGYVAASPWLIGLIVFGAGPILFSMIISFCHYDVLNPARFVGLSNYVDLIGRHFDPLLGRTVWNDPIFWKSLGNTAYMIIGVPISIVLGLAIALLLDAKVRGLHVYRTIFYLPAIVPAVATFILWMWLLEPSQGMINKYLELLGVVDPPKWLRDPVWSKPSIILMGLWGVGSGMIIWLAGLKDIPESLYEAASIDGAGRLRQFFHITLPLLSPYIFFNMIMGMIATFQVFEAALIMTDGGPADTTLFYAYKLFNEAFRYLNMGAASAMAWLMFVVVLIVTLFQLWLGKKWVHYGE